MALVVVGELGTVRAAQSDAVAWYRPIGELMELAQLIVQIGMLAGIGWLCWRNRPASVVVATEPEAQNDGLVEVLRVDPSGQWKHHAWVRERSPAYQKHWDAAGFALQRPGERLDLGRQE